MKKYNVFGCGNALVDIITEVDDHFFKENEVEKGLMTLVDEKRQLSLMKSISQHNNKMSGGGSAANTLVALSQFGGSGYYACVVARDALGKFFLEDLRRNDIDVNLKYENCMEGHTGRCLVMVSPDAQRTMNTFLGVSSYLSPDQIDQRIVNQAEWVYLEGYLVASPTGLDALKLTKKYAEKWKIPTALTFSDPSMVKYFSAQMNEIVGASVDLLFCNEEEAIIFTETDGLDEARKKMKELAKRFVITMGENGALIYDGDTFIEIEPHPVKAVDTNGAGDMFAGAFMYGITHRHSFAEAGKLASLASSYVVKQFGPRLMPDQIVKIKDDLLP